MWLEQSESMNAGQCPELFGPLRACRPAEEGYGATYERPHYMQQSPFVQCNCFNLIDELDDAPQYCTASKMLKSLKSNMYF